MDSTQKEDILKAYYFTASNPAAYSGAPKLYRIINRKYPKLFSLKFVENWLNNQDAYSIQKGVRHRFKTANVRVSTIGEQFDIDLLSMINISKENDGVQYLLFCIDIFSRQVWAKPLKNKTAKSVLNAMEAILKDQTPKKIRSDNGSEFSNHWFRKFMKDNNVYYFTTRNPPKANYVERVQRTIKTALYRMMRHRRSYRYIDHLNDIVANYNATPHRSLGYLAPNDINKDNEADVWAYMYLKKKMYNSTGKLAFRFKKGDYVRISFVKHPFRRAYQEQFTTEIFKVASRFNKQGIAMYKLIDLNDDSIKGSFYNAELQKVDKDENSLWYIEKILKKRKRNKKLEYFVKWQGFPKIFNSWIDAAEVKNQQHA